MARLVESVCRNLTTESYPTPSLYSHVLKSMEGWDRHRIPMVMVDPVTLCS